MLSKNDQSATPAKKAGVGERIELVLITGISGSGKSTVANSFEDLGYYCIDNLPMPLLREVLKAPASVVPDAQRIALVSDVRAPGLSELPALMQNVDRSSVDPIVLFLDTSDEVLVRRYAETRRRHPLAEEGQVMVGIERERKLLSELRGMADMVLNTSEWTLHDLRSEIYREFGRPGQGDQTLTVSLVSFGFKHGVPFGANLMFDVRYLPNPHFIPELRDHTGLDLEIQQYLDQQEGFSELIDRLDAFLSYMLPRFRAENRSYLTVAIGCTGGHHRSVATVERLSERLRDSGWTIHAVHRDIDR